MRDTTLFIVAVHLFILVAVPISLSKILPRNQVHRRDSRHADTPSYIQVVEHEAPALVSSMELLGFQAPYMERPVYRPTKFFPWAFLSHLLVAGYYLYSALLCAANAGCSSTSTYVSSTTVSVSVTSKTTTYSPTTTTKTSATTTSTTSFSTSSSTSTSTTFSVSVKLKTSSLTITSTTFTSTTKSTTTETTLRTTTTSKSAMMTKYKFVTETITTTPTGRKKKRSLVFNEDYWKAMMELDNQDQQFPDTAVSASGVNLPIMYTSVYVQPNVVDLLSDILADHHD